MDTGLFSRNRYVRKFFLFFLFLFFSTPFVTFAQTVTYTDSSGINPRSSPSYAGGYTVQTFTSTGTTTFTIPLNVTSIDYLVVAGGGGGGTGGGGGGGGGGMLTGNGTTTFYSGNSYTVVVGGGGMGGDNSPNWYGTNGSSSVLGNITALGGGGGGGNDGAEVGRNGGSGGGAGYGGSAGSGTSGQGNNGGSPGSPQAGGGGGAGEAGSTDSSGYGGDGLSSSISGTATWYAGGGGGRNTGGSSGGTGGGGAEGQNGTSGTGGGGGGYFPTRGDGGSGIVIIRYLTPDSNLAVLATSTSVSYVAESSATFSGSLISIGGASITSRGICYGTTRYPTNCVAEGGTATGDFSMTLSNLATSTTYFYRSYATNSYGTSTSADGVFTTEGLTNSIMFDSASSQYLNRTFSTPTDNKKWTWSGWVKKNRTTPAGGESIFLGYSANNNDSFTRVGFVSGDNLSVSGYNTTWRKTNKVFRDPSTWQHIIVVYDSATSTANSRVRIYVNGVEETSFETTNNPTQNASGGINAANAHYISKMDSADYSDVYMADVNFVDGQALTPSYFGKSDSNTGNWIPKSYQGTYGVNGFHLNFSSSTALGLDTAPIDSTHTTANTWTTNGSMSSTTNQFIDTPFNNFATLNPLQRSSSLSLTKGNLTSSLGGGYYNIYGVMASMPIKDFDTYFEAKLNNTTRTISSSQVGVVDWDIETNRNIFQTSAGSGSDAAAVIAHGGGDYIKIPGSSTSDGVSYTTSDTIMVAVSPSLRKVWFGKNGTWNNGSNPVTNSGGHTFASSSVTGYFPIFRVNPDAETESATLNFGQKSFSYTPPTGFKSLSTANLPAPTILKPNQHFDVVTRTGTAIGYTKSGLVFQPDLIWSKGRSGSTNHYLQDAVRGFGGSKSLSSNTTGYEAYNGGAPSLHSFSSTADGYTLNANDSDNNANGATYVDWLWKAGNSTTTNTSGTVTSVVSANQTAGFSVATFTGSGSTGTVGHGLNATPTMVIFKSRDNVGTTGWNVWHQKLTGADYYLDLSTTAAQSNGSSNWSGAWSTTTFGLTSTPLASGADLVAYSFAEVQGYSKFGSYTGNGSADGPFIYTGFKPRWIMIKRTDSTNDWHIIDTKRDSYNVNYNPLFPNLSQGESPDHAYDRDILSNGFKIRSSISYLNTNGGTFIYAAFAESVMVPTVPSLPTLSSPTATSTTETTAVIGGTVDTIGSSNITSRGVCYGSTPAPITNCTAGTGTTTGVFTVSITGLATSTTYYYSAYATNSYGTAYSSDSTFTTDSLTNSLMFDSAQSQYLNRTFSTPTDNKKFTWSGWVKRSKLTSGYPALFAAPGTTDELIFDLNDHIQYYNNAAVSSNLNTTQVFRDPSAWYHIVLAVDTTQAVSSDRVKIFSNGTQITSFSSANYPALNYSQGFNSAISHQVAKATGAHYYDGYLSDVNFIDGQQLTPASFGETSSSTGNWIPKKYIGSYGNNGFRLNFSNSNQVGADSSGNSNNWASNGGITSTNNQVTDTPLNNFATLNALTLSAGTLSLGNLRFSALTANSQTKLGTIGVSSGKWYWETNIGAVSVGTDVGISPASLSTYANGYFPGSDSLSYSYDQNGQKYTSNSGTAYGSTYTNGDVIGTALDMDAGTLTFYKNGVSQGVAFSSLSGVFVPAMASYGGGNYFTANFGQKSFTYTPPEGFKSLSTANLSTPVILKPNLYFDVATYTGTGSTQSITGLDFQPDLVWIKDRNTSASSNIIDSVRGARKHLESDTTNTETAEASGYGLTSFNSDGFTVGTDNAGSGRVNFNGDTFVSWNWKASGATTTDTSGTITSTVSANPTAGFSIVSYSGSSSGNGDNKTVGHGLGTAPNFAIVKARSGGAENWYTWNSNFGGGTYWLALSQAASLTNDSTRFYATSTDSVLNLGGNTGVSASGYTYVAYVWSEVPGYSKFGSYTGNGNSDGAFVYTGFKPRYILTKRIDGGTEHWNIFDTTRAGYNSANYLLYANSSNADDTTTGRIDILANGFKARDNGSGYNSTGATYIYAAFAESIMIPTVPTASSQESGSTNLEDLTVTPNNSQATIDYTIPSNPSFNQVIVLRSTQTITDSPSNGATYSTNDIIGSATVACVDSTIATSTYDSCIATGLSNSTAYYFKVFTKSGTVYTAVSSIEGSPSTPNVGASNVTVTSYRLRQDNGDESSATYNIAENTPMASDFITGDKIRLRFVVTNHTTSLINKRYQLEYSYGSCTSWTAVPRPSDYTNEHFKIDTSSYVSDSASTTHSSGISVPNGKVFRTGRMQTFNSLSRPTVLYEGEYTEIEYLIRSTGDILPGSVYCFRLSNNGDASDFTYSATPQITTMSRIFRYNAGGGGGGRTLNFELPSVVATTTVTGGGADGSPTSTSTITESTATTTTQQSTTTPTRRRGGGGNVGTLYNDNTLALVNSGNINHGMVLGAFTESMCTNMKSKMLYGKRDNNTNGEVSQLQYYLRKQGYFNTKVTGNFLNITKKAVKKFQEDNSLTVTGEADKLTRDRIKDLGCIKAEE